TAFYSWRLLILTFHGKPRADHHTMEHVHESPAVMLIPLLVLALGALFTGAAFHELFVGDLQAEFWNDSIFTAEHNHVLHAAHGVPEWVPLAPTVIAIAGIALAYLFYMFAPAIPARLAATFPGLYRFLLNKWYFDELYNTIFVRPFRRLSRIFWKTGDATIIDGVPNGVAAITVDAARGVARFQTGRVANYAFTMIAGLVVFVSVIFLGFMR
ncbi:MAG TPA: NADH-quinone oxidoreductase subunit L, partial [Roseomonas sp.]